MPETVLVTEKEYRKAEDVFKRSNGLRIVPVSGDEAALSAAILQEKSRAVIVGVDRYVAPLYRALHTVAGGKHAVIARFGVGHDGVDKVQASQRSIVVCNTPGALDISVAEQAMWLLGCLARHVSRAETNFRAGKFSGDAGVELRGKKLGILGFGQIGRRVAQIACFGFGMTVGAANASGAAALEMMEKRSLAEIKKAYGVETFTTDVGELLRESDYVTVHLPAVPRTRHFINADTLALMKPTAGLVNTARGSVLDEAALYDALVAKRIAGAALDVFEQEPYEPAAPGKDLRTLSNVVLTPHIGSNTREANQRIAEACVKNLEHFFADRVERMSCVPAVVS